MDYTTAMLKVWEDQKLAYPDMRMQEALDHARNTLRLPGTEYVPGSHELDVPEGDELGEAYTLVLTEIPLNLYLYEQQNLDLTAQQKVAWLAGANEVVAQLGGINYGVEMVDMPHYRDVWSAIFAGTVDVTEV